ncbi:hypothetical protein ACFY7Y_14470 [Streptomyces virginiae]|uniref:hypothetical protein n=1 Tax=Streptomyces virginiae TaxID=1961 RepID=UPI0036965C59
MSWSPTDARGKALHWAAVASGLNRSMTADGSHLSADDKGAYAQYIDDAHQLGITDNEIDEYLHTRLGK